MVTVGTQTGGSENNIPTRDDMVGHNMAIMCS